MREVLNGRVAIHVGDCRDVLRSLPEQSVHCIVTSPPYYGLRDYGTAEWEGGDPECSHIEPASGPTQNKGNNGRMGSPYRDECRKCGANRIDRQIGLESSPAAYVEAMVEVFRECWRVLRDDGTLWLNIGDSYCSPNGGFQAGAPSNQVGGRQSGAKQAKTHAHATYAIRKGIDYGVKYKDLLGIPWLLAFALRDDGWHLRAANVWAKPNPMPESVRDRTTSSYEMVFMLTKRARYFYDAEAVREPAEMRPQRHLKPKPYRVGIPGQSDHGGVKAPRDEKGIDCPDGGRNLRNVWTIATQPCPLAHFATFPPKLAEICIKAGTSEKGVCPLCGKPWERVTEREASGAIYADVSGRGGALRNDTAKWAGRIGELNTQTLGWQPACSCPSHKPVPATVLDPFAGAGTSGLVAARLHRRAVLIELNPGYADMIEKRLDGDGAPLFETAPSQPESTEPNLFTWGM